MDRGAWQAAVHRVTKSRTRLSNWARMHALSDKFLEVGFSVSWHIYFIHSAKGVLPKILPIDTPHALINSNPWHFFISAKWRGRKCYLNINLICFDLHYIDYEWGWIAFRMFFLVLEHSLWIWAFMRLLIFFFFFQLAPVHTPPAVFGDACSQSRDVSVWTGLNRGWPSRMTARSG